MRGIKFKNKIIYVDMQEGWDNNGIPDTFWSICTSYVFR